MRARLPHHCAVFRDEHLVKALNRFRSLDIVREMQTYVADV
jgi:hypothetical protein